MPFPALKSKTLKIFKTSYRLGFGDRYRLVTELQFCISEIRLISGSVRCLLVCLVGLAGIYLPSKSRRRVIISDESSISISMSQDLGAKSQNLPDLDLISLRFPEVKTS